MQLKDLQKIFENATEDELSKINTYFQKDKDLIKKLQDENNTLVTNNTELKQNIDELQVAKGNTEELQTKLTELQIKLKEQEEKYKKETEERQLNDIIANTFTDKNFVNEMTKKGYAEELKKALQDPNNKGKSAKDLFETMTKDVEGIFVNQHKVEIPPIQTSNSFFYTKEQMKNMSTDEINKNWENISKSLANLK